MAKMMTKEDVTEMILSAKRTAGMKWEEIAEKIGMSPVWTHSAAMGMNAMPKDKAEAMVSVMGLPQEAALVLQEYPTKIWEQAVPTDPCIYRLYEIVGVYGPTIKTLIQEEFGDGIMSAIDFDMQITRVANPKGDRVKIEMSGKFLGYNPGDVASSFPTLYRANGCRKGKGRRGRLERPRPGKGGVGLYAGQQMAEPERVYHRAQRDRGVPDPQVGKGARVPADQGALGVHG